MGLHYLAHQKVFSSRISALGRVWDNYEQGRWRGARDNAPEKLFELLKDEVPEVRSAAVFALGTFVNSCEVRTEHANSQ